ncbi:cytochrome c-type biogenesis protein [Roseicyclus sp.]|uniref:cytochrome c-type biogenesis protein n=1 Tax=Roseicyclus sp. TaxID=1914329 RepID=UPI003F6B398F
MSARDGLWRFAAAVAMAAMVLGAGLPAVAVQPDEVLSDTQLEERARDISAGLRCVVCRNESIDQSNAEIARDLRLLVRERLVAGDSDDDVMRYIVERYGEYVLMRPTMTGSNILLWLAPLMLIVAGGGLSLAYIRRRAASAAPTEAALSPEEEARLAAILKE